MLLISQLSLSPFICIIDLWVSLLFSLFVCLFQFIFFYCPQDLEVDNFFRHCQKFDGSPAMDIEMVKIIKVEIVFSAGIMKRNRWGLGMDRVHLSGSFAISGSFLPQYTPAQPLVIPKSCQ